jgi:hypothetical protein
LLALTNIKEQSNGTLHQIHSLEKLHKEFPKDNYKINYAPNSRETFRRLVSSQVQAE